MKAESDKKKRKHLASHPGPMPVDVSIPSETLAEPEDYHFTSAAIGTDTQVSLQLPQARGSPYDDQNGKGGLDESNQEEVEDKQPEDEEEDGDSE
jgi:hypothetical protein